ncbi:hypothetical protein NDU88_002995 [Pleurodeles waltl]|uniref:Uncharacterized protein n=1 Tax=Pleurodeles waltl TaxID=8319 RepID=A0AAV7RG58_PLEWA|nr:hypothetical protein NDU88_002995 [Pleurodeles waltl]
MLAVTVHTNTLLPEAIYLSYKLPSAHGPHVFSFLIDALLTYELFRMTFPSVLDARLLVIGAVQQRPGEAEVEEATVLAGRPGAHHLCSGCPKEAGILGQPWQIAVPRGAEPDRPSGDLQHERGRAVMVVTQPG